MLNGDVKYRFTTKPAFLQDGVIDRCVKARRTGAVTFALRDAWMVLVN